jgi:hypothetical protein
MFVSLQKNSYAQNAVDFKNAMFILSKKWFQLTGDNREGTFRSFAAVVSERDGLIDFPNIFVMRCRSSKHFLTIHFPESYKFERFAPTTWLPKSDIHVRTKSGTFTLVAELNSNEFHVDLDNESFGYLRQIFNSDLVEMKIGPTLDDVRMAFGNGEIDKSHREIINKFVKKSNKRIYNEYDFDEVYRLCLSQKSGSATGNHWMILGTVSCPKCDDSLGATSANISIGTKKNGGYISSESECQKAMDAFERALKEKRTSSDLRCIRVADPDGKL